jgi:hypothetical protein
MSQPSITTGRPTQPVPQPSPPPVYRTPRSKQFSWFAMIIAVVKSFGMGAAVDRDGAEYIGTQELN